VSAQDTPARARAMLGKVAVVTGAGQGLGRAIAQAMADEGARVVVCDIHAGQMDATCQQIHASGGEALAWRCDVSDRAAVDAMFEEVGRRFGRVDVLVNNAGLVPSTQAEEELRKRHYAYRTTPMPRQSLRVTSSLSDEDWHKWWGVNVHGVFYCTRAALRFMERQAAGRIINVASVAGLGAGSMHSPGYSATKAAVISLTRTTAFDVAGANILVNAIAPGGVNTPPMLAYLEGATEEQRASLFQLVPLGRFAEAEQYAKLAVYLAGEDHYFVGQVLSPNGGYVI
jgi:3-oxoacyl-[acyl-carrier protein] reductase